MICQRITWRVLTQHPASLVPLGWVYGILQSLPMVVQRSAHQDHGSGMKDLHDSNDKVHWVPLVNPPNIHNGWGRRMHLKEMGALVQGLGQPYGIKTSCSPVGSQWRPSASPFILTIPTLTSS